ncbi:Ribonuclease H2 subunit C [Cryptosporidium felis]|nr:Ribonuclease H2 subunit C [Cryptosporidium felis]
MLLNILPFQISFDGRLPENNPFNQKVDNRDEKKLLEVNQEDFGPISSKSFRGRKLNGRTLDLNSHSHVILISSANVSEGSSEVTIDGSIDKLVYWNYDDQTYISDDIPQVLNAIYYSNIIHSET